MAVLALLYLIFFVRLMRQSVKLSPAALKKWNDIFKVTLVAGISLLVLEKSFSLYHITMWMWYAAVLPLVVFSIRKEEFAPTKTLTIAFLPQLSVVVLGDIIRLINAEFYKKSEDVLDVAGVFAFFWLIAFWLYSDKQRKALEQERLKRHFEEEQHRIMAARKNELEILVAERTAALTQQKEELEVALNELKSTQDQLIQQEKLASLGELTAGIAHEIQNPLNFVNNFSEVSTELVQELREGLLQKLSASEQEYAAEIMDDLSQNLEKITYHGKRADSIVKGMLQHSRASTGKKELTDINALADEYMRLSYHGLRAKDKTFNAQLETSFDSSMPLLRVVPQDMGRVLLNLFNNAFYAVQQKRINLGSETYQPQVQVSTSNRGEVIEIRIRDNGIGVPENIRHKILQPFFTTKPTGQGTGLGLSLSFDIITKGHGGDFKIETREGEFTEFIITIPVHEKDEELSVSELSDISQT